MSYRPRVLLVDYNPRNLRRMRDLLSKAGLETLVASGGDVAVEEFKRSVPDLVLIVEAMLPRKHGFDVCREIKESFSGKNVPVIIMTSVYKGRRYRAEALYKHGCDEYIELPCPDDKILIAVRGQLGLLQAAPPPAQETRDGADAQQDAASAPEVEAPEEHAPVSAPREDDAAKVIAFPVQPEAGDEKTGAPLVSEGDINKTLDEFFGEGAPPKADSPVADETTTSPSPPPSLPAAPPEGSPAGPPPPPHVEATEEEDSGARIEMKMEEPAETDVSELIAPPDEPADVVEEADAAWASGSFKKPAIPPELEQRGPLESVPDLDRELESVFDFLKTGASHGHVTKKIEKTASEAARTTPAKRDADSDLAESVQAAAQDMAGLEQEAERVPPLFGETSERGEEGSGPEDVSEAAAEIPPSPIPARRRRASRTLSRIILIVSAGLAGTILVVLGALLLRTLSNS
jgi:CheY-like chemotaxis protein